MVSLVVVRVWPSPADLFIHAIIPVFHSTTCQNGHRGARSADHTDTGRLNDSIDQQRIPINLLNTSPGRKSKQNVSPFAVLIDGVLRNIDGCVPALSTNRVPPSRILLIAKHDDMNRYDTQSLAYFLLNIHDTTLINRNGRETIRLRYITTVPTKVISAGMN